MTKGKYFREPDKFFAEPKPYGLGFTGSVLENSKRTRKLFWRNLCWK